MKVNLVIRHKPVKCQHFACIYGGEASMGEICLDFLLDSSLYSGEWYCFHPECFVRFMLPSIAEDRFWKSIREMNTKVEEERIST